MEFLTSKDLKLNPAGYLINKTTNKPVTHADFVSQQKNAEYIVKLADAIKDANFTCGKVDNLEEIKASVMAAINAKNVKEYIAVPSKPVSKANEELVKFALDFVAYEENKSEVEMINKIMAQFDSIEAVESVGEYFSESLIKLNRIYTMAEILKAVKINTSKLK